jgi:hypothetical protein
VKRFAAVAVLWATLAWACGVVWAEVVATCPRAPAPPILDGNVTLDEWIQAGRLSPFVLLHNQGLPREATDVRVMYDDQALYVAAILYDSDTDHLRAEVKEADGDVYTDDCFELFIDAIGTGQSYSHIVINSIGTRFDEVDGNRGETVAGWNAGVTVKRDQWSVELVVPFTGGRPPAEGAVWKIGAARYESRLDEYSSWNGFVNGFHEPALFGPVRFGGRAVCFSLVDVGAMKLGHNTAVLFADNATAEAATLKANLRVNGRDRAGHYFGTTKFVALPGARTPVEAPYEVTQDGEGDLVISVTDAKGQAVYRTAPFPLFLPPITTELFAVESALVEADRQWLRIPDSPAKDQLRKGLDALTDERNELDGLVRQRMSLSLAQLKEVERALGNLRGRVEELTTRLRAAALAGGQMGAFMATPVGSLTKVFPDQPPPTGEPEARIDACRNEWESFQIALTPLADRVVKLSAQATDLVGPSSTIPATQLEVRVVGNVPAADHLTRGAPKRLWPDILTPALPDTETIELKPGEVRALWVSVHVPPDAVPGEYAGTVSFAGSDGPAVAVPVRVVVHHPVLPSPGDYHVSVGFWQAPQRIAQQYGLEAWSREHWDRLRPYVADLAAHGQKLASVTRDMFEWRMDESGQPLFRYTVFDRYVELCREAGIDEGIEYYSMFNGGGDSSVSWADTAGDTHSETANPGDERFDKLWTAFLTDFAKHLEEKGWLSNVFICPTDEPRDSANVPTLQRFAHCADLVHAANPALKTTVALDSLDSARTLAPCTDRMVFKLRDDVYDRELAASKQAAGGLVEAYICCHPDRPNTFITSPNIDSRVIGWLLFREKLTGLLRWSYERWPPDPMGQPEGDGRYAAGDLFIVYPGKEGPYDSPRWEILRDGFEDHELLSLLQQAIGAARAGGRTEQADTAQKTLDEAIARVVGAGPALAEFSNDPHELELARVKVLTTLDWLGG